MIRTFPETESALLTCFNKPCMLKDFEGHQNPGIIGLCQEEMSIFLKQGSLGQSQLAREDYGVSEIRQGINLVCNVDAQENLWDEPGPGDLSAFIRGMVLSAYDDGQELHLVSPRSLLELLPAYRDNFRGKFDGSAEAHARRVELDPVAYELVASAGDFQGRVSVCDYRGGGMPCDEPLCFSEFIWKADGRALLYFSTGCDIVTCMKIYPDIQQK